MIILTMISATWCSSCLTMKKILKEIVSEDSKIELKIIDYDLNRDEVKNYPVFEGDVLPILIIKDKRLVGEHKQEDIMKFIKENM